MIKQVMIFFLISTSFLSKTYAEDVVFLNKNQTTPFAGYLFPEAKAKEVRDGLIERDGFKLINISLEKSLELQKDNNKDIELKLALVTDQNQRLSENLNAERNTSGWVKMAYFALGAISMGLLYNVAKATN